MPELPEVETISKQLHEVLSGKTIKAVEVLRDKSLPGHSSKLSGKKILNVGRKQKIIVMSLSEEWVMLIHLKMTGQLIYLGEKTIVGGHPTADWVGELPSKHTRVIIHFIDSSTLYFNDQRVFGWVKVIPSEQWLVLRKKMPPDVIDKEFTVEYLERVLKKSGRAVKLVILDQAKMGGMGNIYACDALFLAGINPLTTSNQLKIDVVTKLHQAMVAVLHKGIETGGASLSHFVDSKGLGGHYQDHFQVYNQEGKLCVKCGSKIIKIKLGGRGTYFCPKCQR